MCIFFRKTVLFLLLVCTIISAKPQDTIQLEGFNNVDIFGKINIRLEQSDRCFITAGHNNTDISNVKFEVNNSLLTVKYYGKVIGNNNINITIGFKSINTIKTAGGCYIYNHGAINSSVITATAASGSNADLLINADTAIITANKGGFIKLSGTAKHVELKTSTGGSYYAQALKNQTTIALMRGGMAEIFASELIDAKITLGATLLYAGTPKTIKKEIKSKGSIQAVEKEVNQ